MRPASLLFIVILTFALRAPFFSVDVIDWDESTFILMGDAWAQGLLPYTRLWDNKPPLCFAPFALLQLAVGKSIVAVRIMGALCVAAAGIAMARAGAKLCDERTGVIAGAATVVLATFASRGQATMSETLAIAPLAWASLPLLTDRLGPRSAALSGLGFAIAALIRLNLAVVALAALIWIVSRQRRLAPAFALGGALPLVALTALYGGAGELVLFWSSVFVAPFAYALGGLELASVLRGPWLAAALPARMRLGPPPVFWLLVVAVVGSILVSGGGSAHYWIQAHPFSGLLIAYLLSGWAARLPRGAAWAFLVFIPLAAALSDTPWHRLGEESRTRALARHLEEKGASGQPVFLLTEHLAHWWLGSKPLHPMATHPSNLFRPELLRAVMGPEATPERVLRAIIERTPTYVARERYVRRLDDAPAAREYLERVLREDYVLEAELRGVRLYRRR